MDQALEVLQKIREERDDACSGHIGPDEECCMLCDLLDKVIPALQGRIAHLEAKAESLSGVSITYKNV